MSLFEWFLRLFNYQPKPIPVEDQPVNVVPENIPPTTNVGADQQLPLPKDTITESDFKKISPNTPNNLVPIVTEWFNKDSVKYGVNTPIRITAFFSQMIHESNSFKAMKEYATGSAYEGRKDLGNIYAGDGIKFKGRGYIQITGRNNYAAVSKFIFNDNTLLNNPDLLATPQYAMLSAFWYWNLNNLNSYADKSFLKTITKRINGGLNGWDDRLKNYNRICDFYGLPHWTE